MWTWEECHISQMVASLADQPEGGKPRAGSFTSSADNLAKTSPFVTPPKHTPVELTPTKQLLATSHRRCEFLNSSSRPLVLFSDAASFGLAVASHWISELCLASYSRSPSSPLANPARSTGALSSFQRSFPIAGCSWDCFRRDAAASMMNFSPSVYVHSAVFICHLNFRERACFSNPSSAQLAAEAQLTTPDVGMQSRTESAASALSFASGRASPPSVS